MGLIQTQDEDYFLEPMASTEKNHHLFYKRSTLLTSMPRNSATTRKCALTSSYPQGRMNA